MIELEIYLNICLGKLPKNYNPDVDPDPERWLPRWERSTFKHKKAKRGTNTIGVSRV